MADDLLQLARDRQLLALAKQKKAQQAPGSMGLPSSAPVSVGGGGGFSQVDRKEAFDSYGFTDAVRDVGLAPAVVDQIGLGLSNMQHAFGQAV